MNAGRSLWVAGLVLVAAATNAAAQSKGVAGGSTIGSEAADDAPSPWSWIKMPKITMPKIEMPKMPADPLAPIKTSARKVSDGTKRAWEGTKELFTFGGSSSREQPRERLASKPEQPSVWQRMFGGGEEPEGPQTVADWMAQPRPE